MTWWLDPDADWSAGEPKKLLELLVSAYDERPQIGRLALFIGVDVIRDVPAVAEPMEAWSIVVTRAVSEGTLLYLLQLVLGDSAAAVFHEQLRTLLSDAGLDGGALQAINDPLRGIIESTEAIDVLRNAKERTALIEVNGIPRGTGFLIGPDLIMTAAHVVSGASDIWPPAAGLPPVVAIFDRIAGTGAPAESGKRVAVVEFVVGSPPTKDELNGKHQTWNAPATHLDYAIGKLARPVATERGPESPLRGFYTIHRAYDFDVATDIRISQQLLAGAQFQSGARAFQKNANVTRVRYLANTTPGASGSACYDARGRLVALHHYAAAGMNQGIPMSAVAADLVSRGLDSLVETPPLLITSAPVVAPEEEPPAPPDPFLTLHFGLKPFINRGVLRDSVKLMFGPHARILSIQGGRGGKSYTFSLLTHLAERAQAGCKILRDLAPDGVMAHEIDLDRYGNIAASELSQRLMQDILRDLGADIREGSPFAQQARSFNDVATWLPTHLKQQRVLRWLFIDNLDRFVFLDDAKDLFKSLAAMVEKDFSIPLRLVFVLGEKSDVGDYVAPWAERDSIPSLSAEEAVQWLERCLNGAAVPTDQVRAKVNAIYAGQSPAPEIVARKVANALVELRNGK